MTGILDCMPFLKSSKLFVTNLSTIFILGILIYYKQLYEILKRFDFFLQV